MTGPARIAGSALIAVVLAAAPAARADGAPDKASGSQDLAVRAKESFQRGVQLYEERDFGGAGVEFRRAYDLLPNFRILFNQGRVAVELRDYASAIELFARYLADGGDQVPAERHREVTQEIDRLKPRVGQIKVVADEASAAVYLDDALVGRTPMAPLNVNVGRHRLEFRPKQGPSELQMVDCPGQETVVARFIATATHLAPVHPLESTETQMVRGNRESRPIQPGRSRLPWLGWTATGLCAAGAVVFGIMAYRSSNDLRELRDTYPVSPEALDSKQRSTRILSGIADGLLAGAVVLGGLSLYFSFDHPARGSDAKATASPWPSAVNITGHF